MTQLHPFPVFHCLILVLAAPVSPTTSPYVKVERGDPDTNVIISSPHGGRVKIEGGWIRQQGSLIEGKCDYDPQIDGPKVPGKCKVITVSDHNTQELARIIRDTIHNRTGIQPHFVASDLHRSQLDPNRKRMEASQRFSVAEAAYDTFHGAIDNFSREVEANVGSGIVYDIHGYVKYAADDWIMLGYNVRKGDLNSGVFDDHESSIKAMARRSNYTFTDILLDAEISLGGIMEGKGLKTCPSPSYPKPNMGILGGYYRGGHITREHGSLYGGNVDCVQIEHPPTMRGLDDIGVYGVEVGDAIVEWMDIHYNN